MPTDARTIRIRRLAPGQQPDRWIRALSAFDPASARILKQERTASVFRAEIDGRDVVIKVRHLAKLSDRLKMALSAGRGDRHWRGAEVLTSLQLSTAHPLVLATGPFNGAMSEWLVMEALPGKTVLQHLADHDLTPRQEHLIACEMGTIAETLHRRGHFNRDPKPSNHIVCSLDPVRIAVIDCIAIQPRRDRGLERMLASMVIEAIGCHCPPRRALMMRALSICRSESPRVLWKKVADIIRAHGDPTPRTNPVPTPPP